MRWGGCKPRNRWKRKLPHNMSRGVGSDICLHGNVHAEKNETLSMSMNLLLKHENKKQIILQREAAQMGTGRIKWSEKESGCDARVTRTSGCVWGLLETRTETVEIHVDSVIRLRRTWAGDVEERITRSHSWDSVSQVSFEAITLSYVWSCGLSRLVQNMEKLWPEWVERLRVEA